MVGKILTFLLDQEIIPGCNCFDIVYLFPCLLHYFQYVISPFVLSSEKLVSKCKCQYLVILPYFLIMIDFLKTINYVDGKLIRRNNCTL